MFATGRLRGVKRGLSVGITLLFLVFIATLPIAYKKAGNYMNYNDYSNVEFPITDGFYHYDIKDPSQTERVLFDHKGVRMFDYGGSIGKQYNPVTISQFVLGLIPHRDDKRIQQIVFRQLQFLISYSHETKEGNLMFPYLFDWPINGEKAPWYSSMAQGQAASAFLWGFRMSNNRDYFLAAKKSILAMIEKSDLFTRGLQNGFWLKEYPNYRFNVLDGSLAAIAGVHDLYRWLDDTDPDKEKIAGFLNQAVIGFKSNWNCFRCFLGGHYFSDDLTIASEGYYTANLAWLDYLSRYDDELLRIKNFYSVKEDSLFKGLLRVYWNAVFSKILRPMNVLKPCVG